MSPDKLKLVLPEYYVYLLEANFFLLILAFIFNFKYIKAIFAGIERKYLYFLAAISLTAIFSALFINPKIHRIYYDEDIYCSIAQCIAHQHRAVMCNEGYYENNELTIVADEYNKQPAAYPYLLSVIFRIFGTNELYAFIYNNLLFGVMAVVVFMIAYLLFNDVYAGLAASLFYILIPVNIQWFNTCAVEPSTTFFTGTAILTALIYVKNKKPVNLFLFTTALAFSFSFRPESFQIVLVIGLIFLFKDIGVLKRKEFYLFAILLLVLSCGIVLHIYAMKDYDWGAKGPKLSTEYFSRNFKTNTMFYLNNWAFPLLFTVFAFTGFIFYKLRFYREKIIVLSWLMVSFGIFLFFYAGIYNHDEWLSIRFSILSYAPIAIFAGLGLSFLRGLFPGKIKAATIILVLLVVFNACSFLPFIRSQARAESAACRTDHFYAMKFVKLLPENSIIFTHNPNMFLIHKKSALQTSTESFNPGTIERLIPRFKGGVYVHFNYWSGVPYDAWQRSFTEHILNSYEYEIVEEYYFKNYKFGLYKLTERR